MDLVLHDMRNISAKFQVKRSSFEATVLASAAWCMSFWEKKKFELEPLSLYSRA